MPSETALFWLVVAAFLFFDNLIIVPHGCDLLRFGRRGILRYDASSRLTAAGKEMVMLNPLNLFDRGLVTTKCFGDVDPGQWKQGRLLVSSALPTLNGFSSLGYAYLVLVIFLAALSFRIGFTPALIGFVVLVLALPPLIDLLLGQIWLRGSLIAAGGYLGQYRLEDDGGGRVKMSLVRQFGRYSGRKEIEAIAVDSELGYVYYSDEGVGVRKSHADPDAAQADDELALFAKEGFADDHEGISIYKRADGTGFLLVSDQQANRFWVFPREGASGRPHEHNPIAIVDVCAIESDGSDVTGTPLGPAFPHGLFVTMSNGRVFHYYAWEDIAAAAGW